MQAAVALFVTIVFTIAVVGCAERKIAHTAVGDPEAGRAAIERHQCGVCHVVPGVSGARGVVGPPLTAYGKRVYIAGQLPQNAALLARWIQDAPAIDAGTTMPKLNVGDDEARDMVAYLYRLR